MWNRIFGKIVFVILLFFTSVWLIHYFIDFIPGTYADFKDPLESNEEIIQQKERFPILKKSKLLLTKKIFLTLNGMVVKMLFIKL